MKNELLIGSKNGAKTTIFWIFSWDRNHQPERASVVPFASNCIPLVVVASSGENQSRGCGWFVGVLKTQSQTYFFMVHCGFLLTKTMTIGKGKDWMECCWLCCLFNSKGWGRFSNRQASSTIVTSLQPWSEVCSWVKDWQPRRFGAAADIRGFGSLQIGDF